MLWSAQGAHAGQVKMLDLRVMSSSTFKILLAQSENNTVFGARNLHNSIYSARFLDSSPNELKNLVRGAAHLWTEVQPAINSFSSVLFHSLLFVRFFIRSQQVLRERLPSVGSFSSSPRSVS